MQSIIVVGFGELTGDIRNLAAAKNATTTADTLTRGWTVPGVGSDGRGILRNDGRMIEIVGIVQTADHGHVRCDVRRKSGRTIIGKERMSGRPFVCVDRDTKDLFCQRL